MERDRQARWDRANLHSVGTKLTPELYTALDKTCDAQGISKYAVIKLLLEGWLVDQGAIDPARLIPRMP